MKNGILKIFFIALMASAVISCSKDEPVQGSVDLDPSSKVVKFGEVFNIKPVYSATGIASSKTYTWKSNADSIVSVKAALGGVGQVTPKRIGQATITYASSDGKLSSSALITVDPRSTIFNGIFYKKAATQSDINNSMLAGFTKSELESTSTYLVYTSASNTITKLIYELDASAKLKALYIILNNTPANLTSAEQYLDERYVNTGKTQQAILYYRNTGIVTVNSFPVNSVLGIFLDLTINASSYPLGVKVMDNSLL